MGMGTAWLAAGRESHNSIESYGLLTTAASQRHLCPLLTMDGCPSSPTPATRPSDLLPCPSPCLPSHSNSPTQHLKLYRCNNSVIQGVTVLSPYNSPNTDAISVSESTFITVRQCNLHCGKGAEGGSIRRGREQNRKQRSRGINSGREAHEKEGKEDDVH